MKIKSYNPVINVLSEAKYLVKKEKEKNYSAIRAFSFSFLISQTYAASLLKLSYLVKDSD